MRSNLTPEQLAHYIKGGYFEAVYMPKRKDVSLSSLLEVGNKIIVWPNIIFAPIQFVEPFLGQMAFDSNSLEGWIPDEDLDKLTIIDEYLDADFMTLPQYLYRIHFFTQDKVDDSFGKDVGLAPMSVGRSYSMPYEETLKTYEPQPDKIERAIWNGTEYQDELEWVTVFG